MTKIYSGTIKYVNGTVEMPTVTDVPEKKNWFMESIFKFNGRRWTPITSAAVKNVDDIVSQIKAAGKSMAVKIGKRKPSSIKYAILTTGVEDFKYI